jgi:DNA replication and repair protein RecF
MLRIRDISVFQFKNYLDKRVDFHPRINGICGKNGAGKTNLLDAIHYLCFTKSYFSRVDLNNVLHDKMGFRIEANFELFDAPEKAICILRESGRKEFFINGEPYERFSQHIGRYPCVVIAPDDAQLITGDSKERRSFLDSIIAQADAEYLKQLIIYKKVLDQRNSHLKNVAESGNKNESLLDVLDEQLIKPGDFIFNKRKDFLISFLPTTVRLYHEISGQPEEINLFYESELLEASFEELMNTNRAKDYFSQRTNSGIHRDDLDIRLGNQSFKSIASQGQRKSLLFALKLAELEVLKKEKKFFPLLLLDDIFEKLDEDRIENLLRKVCIENEGQVFITDTNTDRLKNSLETIGAEFKMIQLA